MFDGIWACASLLHVPSDEMDGILEKVTAALKPGGYLYMSFQYGDGEEIRGHRLYHDYTEKSLSRLMKHQSELHAVKIWSTVDRGGRMIASGCRSLHKKTKNRRMLMNKTKSVNRLYLALVLW